jgi:hypothetical protein
MRNSLKQSQDKLRYLRTRLAHFESINQSGIWHGKIKYYRDKIDYHETKLRAMKTEVSKTEKLVSKT